MRDTSKACATSSADLFAEDVLADPFPVYSELREKGAVVWLSTLGFHALTRYDDVREALRDWRTFSSASGVALNPLANVAGAGTTLASDNPVHAARRKVVARPLAPGLMRALDERLTAEANAIVDQLVTRGRFDAVRDLAWHLPLTVVSHFAGLPETGREQMLEWSVSLPNAAGPDYPASDDAYKARKAQGLSVVSAMQAYIRTNATREVLAPGSWGAMLYDAADRGEIPVESVPAMMRDYLGPSLDTTISAIGSMIALLIANPDQWQRLREDRSLIPSAVLEVVRMESPIQWLSRVLTHDHVIDGVPLAAGTRIMLLYGSANRDDRKFVDAASFDVGRNAAEHLGWGHGVHACIGNHLARLEMAAILRARLDRVEGLELTAPPQRLLNTTFRGFKHIPVRIC